MDEIRIGGKVHYVVIWESVPRAPEEPDDSAPTQEIPTVMRRLTDDEKKLILAAARKAEQHPEFRKIYPDAELDEDITFVIDPQHVQFVYMTKSKQPVHIYAARSGIDVPLGAEFEIEVTEADLSES